MDNKGIDFSSFADPLSAEVAIELEKTDPFPNGLREQFIIPTKADLAKRSLHEGMRIGRSNEESLETNLNYQNHRIAMSKSFQYIYAVIPWVSSPSQPGSTLTATWTTGHPKECMAIL